MNAHAAKQGLAAAIGFPLIMKGVRTRLRPTRLLTWAAVTVVAATFLYSLVYWNTTQHGNTTPDAASRAVIVPLMVMQGVILMGLGTGAVAGGMAKERTYRLLDYQRLTPMPPSAKIIGMLLGLPIREYFMFALTLPFVGWAAYRGGLNPWVLFQFYVVFLSSVLVYHMTALAAGMAVSKPWRAGAFAQGMVVVLYLLLPQFSQFGFTFFEYLTVRPTFLGLVQVHLMSDGLSSEVWRESLQAYRWESVAFFNMQIPPTVFSLVVQGFALVSMYTIVSRKWGGESRLSFSKPFALVFFIITQVFLLGNLIPFIYNDQLFQDLARGVASGASVRGDENQVGVLTVLLVTLAVSGVVCLAVIHMTTSTWHQSVHGLRRHRKRGSDERLSWTDDAATSLPLALSLGLVSCISFVIIYHHAMSAGRISMGSDYGNVLVALLLYLGVLMTGQQLREQGGERIFVMGLFCGWIVPALTMIVVLSAFGRMVMAGYISLPFPAAGFYIAGVMMVDDTTSATANRELMPEPVAAHMRTMLTMSVAGYWVVALGLVLRSRRRWQRIESVVSGSKERAERQDDSSVTMPAEYPPVPQPQAAN
ncbi:MAG: hypothetical protein AAGH88_04890 [Planctomycetota bacterium]